MTNIRLGFTITENISHLKQALRFNQRMGVQFTHSFAQTSEFLFWRQENTDFQQIADEMTIGEGMALGTEDQENKPVFTRYFA